MSLSDPDRSARVAATTAITLLILETLVAMQGVFAYRSHFLTLEQLEALQSPRGLPFIWHLGVTEHSKAATKEHFITGHPGRRGGKYPSGSGPLQALSCTYPS